MLFILRRRSQSRYRQTTTKSRATSFLKVLNELDPLGLFLLIVGCAMLLLPITLESRGVDYYDSAAVIAPTVVGALLLVAFVIWELRFAKKPFLEPRILRNPSILGCMASELITKYFSPHALISALTKTLSLTYFLSTSHHFQLCRPSIHCEL